ncbi:transposase [Agromyces sp. Marseille-Q5079]|uniref:transposase n=1 Tax=Agromyces sp. Marseille-Q5079 TaxID=3439059 RepID=UPI003D9C86EE
MADALADIANELYELPPDEFTAARNARTKELRGSDRALADVVGELRRPSAAAWLVNQLTRRRADELAQLLDLGGQLREAQAEVDASALVALAKERRKVVRALANDAGTLAEELGHPVRGPVLDDVAATLQAAMTDAAASDAVLTGRLTRSLEAIGTEVDLTDAVAAWSAAEGTTRSGGPAPRDEVGERRAKKQRQADEVEAEKRAAELAKAEKSAQAAEGAADEASARLGDARAEVEQATSTRDELREALRELEARLADAEHALAEAEGEAHEREDERDAAVRAAEAARTVADGLRSPRD